MQAQNTSPYTVYNALNGLKTNSVYGITQDKKGFLWLGTDNGLVRFDGFDFKLYTNTAMAGSAITSPQEDAFGRIWCMNFYNQVFYIDNDTLEILPGVVNNSSGYFEFNDKKDKLYLAQSVGGPLELDLKTLEHKKIPTPKYFNTRTCFYFKNNLYLFDNLGNIIRYTNGRFYTLNTDIIKQLKRLGYNLLPLVINDKLYAYENSIYEFYCLDNDIATSANYLLKNYDLRQYTNGKQFAVNKTYMSTNTGYYVFDKSYTITGPYFQDYRVSFVFEDREGQQWVGTLDNGLIKVSNPDLVQLYSVGVGDNGVVCYATGLNNTLWLGFSNGVVKEFEMPACRLLNTYILPEKREVNQLLFDKQNNRMLAFQNNSYFLSNGVCNKIGFTLTKNAVLDSDNSILYTACSDGIKQIYFKPGSEFGKIPAGKEIKGAYEINFFEKFVDNNILTIVANTRGRCVGFDSTAAIFYAGNASGLVYFSSKQAVTPFTDNGKPIYATRLLYNKGKTWVATVSSGVYVLQNNKIVNHYTTANGLTGNSVEALLPYGNQMWLAGVGFINKVSISTSAVTTISASTGLTANKAIGILPLAGNSFLFINTVGVYLVNNNTMSRSMPAPRLYIKQVYLNDKPIDLSTGNTFKYNQNNLRFDFTALQLSDPEGLVFYYRLDDGEWVALPGGQRSLSLTSLNNGAYNLQIKAVNSGGTQSNIVSLPFTINPPFWRAGWFLIFLALLLLAGVYLVFRYNINRINKRNKLLNEKAGLEADVRASQLSALKVQMNPHFIFNALNSIQEFILTNEKKLANTYLGKFSDLMRITLDLSQEEHVPLNEELKALNLYLELENLRFSNDIEYAIDTANIPSTAKILIPPMLLQPFVENAIKHGLLHKRGEKKLFISLNNEPETKLLHCIIADNGIGRKKSGELKKFHPQKHKSFAISATAKRLELLSTGNKMKIKVEYTDLQLPSGEVIGTRVELSIPYLDN